jgi:hypothetical protein
MEIKAAGEMKAPAASVTARLVGSKSDEKLSVRRSTSALQRRDSGMLALNIVVGFHTKVPAVFQIPCNSCSIIWTCSSFLPRCCRVAYAHFREQSYCSKFQTKISVKRVMPIEMRPFEWDDYWPVNEVKRKRRAL